MIAEVFLSLLPSLPLLEKKSHKKSGKDKNSLD